LPRSTDAHERAHRIAAIAPKLAAADLDRVARIALEGRSSSDRGYVLRKIVAAQTKAGGTPLTMQCWRELLQVTAQRGRPEFCRASETLLALMVDRGAIDRAAQWVRRASEWWP
jgi:hypothetical protein